MLDTLGEVVTCALAIVALAVVPLAIARVWWPEVRRALTNVGHALVDMFVMSPSAESTPRAADIDAVYIPVSHTGMDAHTTAEARDITDEWMPPRVGRRLSDEEILIFLAVQKGVDGVRYRFSANQIAALVGGDRNSTLAQIRDIRAAPPAAAAQREHQAQLEQLATNGHDA